MRVTLVLMLCVFLQGCYYLQAARGQVEILSKREPVSELIDAPGTPEPLRERLRLAREIRAFASDELLLPNNRSYTDYVDLGRPYVVWSVVAAPEFAVQPVRWCFPIAGCVSYRGYFRKAAADGFAERQRRRGYDVRIGGVAAYSTLGWFADPLLSTMVRDDEVELAALLFHELAHQVVYVRGDTQFNEAFATVVEEEGVRQWLAHRAEPERIAQYHARRARQADFARLIAETRDALKDLYARELSADEMRAEKAHAFVALRTRYHAVRDGAWNGYEGYDRWFDRELNNADLAAVATYNDRIPELRTLLESLGGDLAAFYEAAPALAGSN